MADSTHTHNLNLSVTGDANSRLQDINNILNKQSGVLDRIFKQYDSINKHIGAIRSRISGLASDFEKIAGLNINKPIADMLSSTVSATRAMDNLKKSFEGVGGVSAKTLQTMKSLAETVNIFAKRGVTMRLVMDDENFQKNIAALENEISQKLGVDKAKEMMADLASGMGPGQEAALAETLDMWRRGLIKSADLGAAFAARGAKDVGLTFANVLDPKNLDTQKSNPVLRWTKMKDTISKLFITLSTEIGERLIPLFEKIEPKIKEIADDVYDIVKSIIDWVEWLSKLDTKWLVLIGSVGLFGKAIVSIGFQWLATRLALGGIRAQILENTAFMRIQNQVAMEGAAIPAPGGIPAPGRKGLGVGGVVRAGIGAVIGVGMGEMARGSIFGDLKPGDAAYDRNANKAGWGEGASIGAGMVAGTAIGGPLGGAAAGAYLSGKAAYQSTAATIRVYGEKNTAIAATTAKTADFAAKFHTEQAKIMADIMRKNDEILEEKNSWWVSDEKIAKLEAEVKEKWEEKAKLLKEQIPGVVPGAAPGAAPGTPNAAPKTNWVFEAGKFADTMKASEVYLSAVNEDMGQWADLMARLGSEAEIAGVPIKEMFTQSVAESRNLVKEEEKNVRKTIEIRMKALKEETDPQKRKDIIKSLQEANAHLLNLQTQEFKIAEQTLKPIEARRAVLEQQTQQSKTLLSISEGLYGTAALNITASIQVVNKINDQIKAAQEALNVYQEINKANKDAPEYLTEVARRQNEILGYQQEQVQLVQKLRDGYLSAITASATSAGRFSKIIIDQDKNLQQSAEKGFARRNFLLGGGQSTAQSYQFSPNVLGGVTTSSGQVLSGQELSQQRLANAAGISPEVGSLLSGIQGAIMNMNSTQNQIQNYIQIYGPAAGANRAYGTTAGGQARAEAVQGSQNTSPSRTTGTSNDASQLLRNGAKDLIRAADILDQQNNQDAGQTGNRTHMIPNSGG